MRWSKTELSVVKIHLTSLLCNGVISKCRPSRGQFVSNIFLVPKPDGSHRLILNLKELNQYIETQHFKLEDYRSVTKLVTENCFFASLDLKDAYHLVPIRVKDRKFLRFYFEEELFQFNCLPFGLCTAPLVFTKILKPVFAKLRLQNFGSNVYLDDFLLLGDSFRDCLSNVATTRSLLEELGFIINEKKSRFTPNQSIQYLGLVFNSRSMTVSLPVEKQKRILQDIHTLETKLSCKIRTFAKFIGRIIAATPAVRYAMLYTKNFERQKFLALKKSGGEYNSTMTIPSTLRHDFLWWKSHIQESRCIRPINYTMEIFSDASLSGWGVACSGKRSHGFWTRMESKNHINFLELQAAFFGLRCFAANFKQTNILLRIDNTTAISYINRMGGVQYPHLNMLTRDIWQWCEKRELWIFASYIQSSDNVEADRESRRKVSESEYELCDLAFRKICTDLRHPDIDFFASRTNNKCERYFSWLRDPGAEAVDAFTVNWVDKNFYAFPPFALILRVLQKIKSDNAEGVLVVPFWPTQPWWPLFNALLIKPPIYFKPNPNLLLSADRTPHPLHVTLTLVAGLLSG
ncbi:uncharacterized protein LOC116160094 isoform X1 [Photinus pyralis]|uniref:uncharacterized protein LOC116159894 isoform X1 n=1 Tax=Photinus pyralis TaxID=7054 RepID=UPI00126723BE|nr:uncharacterized protein LOC116159894 isoform X1 [Photinus pyralis]XP_031329091.1 uncharacterized protein LOC116160094 isoform X1 [Photinus pyralis]